MLSRYSKDIMSRVRIMEICKEINIMAYSTVTSKGQVTIPKAVRDRMGIDEGSKLVFVDDGDRILVYKIESDLESLYGAVKHEGPPIDFKRLRDEIAVEIARDATRKAKESGEEPEKAPRQQGGSYITAPRKVAAKKP